ncbi:MAG: hypothetical protein IPN13_11760 [Bacteroidetes bacterium]|nr:hypothetical protein [Bacteroidota bacterium]
MEAKEIGKHKVLQQERQAHLNNWKISGKSKKEKCLNGIILLYFHGAVADYKEEQGWYVPNLPAPTVKGFSEVTLANQISRKSCRPYFLGEKQLKILHPVSPGF